jgi:hypothetical protein
MEMSGQLDSSICVYLMMLQVAEAVWRRKIASSVNNGLDILWKDAAAAWFELSTRNLPGGTEGSVVTTLS